MAMHPVGAPLLWPQYPARARIDPNAWTNISPLRTKRVLGCPGPPFNLGPYCWRDPFGKRHYKLRTHHLKALVLPYKLVKNLGHGASASVEMVCDQNTQKVYARKVFRNVCARNLEDAKKQFRNEVCIMRRLAPSHHVIKLHATYLAGRELALILDPVASDGDLANFIQEFRDLTEELQVVGFSERYNQIMPRCIIMIKIMRIAFGCLASGLAFIHRQTIRHKDIKPQNILIQKGNVFYTDFGFSLDHSAIGHSTTTTGRPDAFTRRYCAPEVAEHDKRNSKSDIFSLGCVFAELSATLYPWMLPESLIEGPFYQRIATKGRSFAARMKTFPHFGSMLVWMLAWKPDDRPSAHEVCLGIERSRAEMHCELFCPQCLHWVDSAEPRNSNLTSILNDYQPEEPTLNVVLKTSRDVLHHGE